jgi:hypothetical protein
MELFKPKWQNKDSLKAKNAVERITDTTSKSKH